MKTLCLSLAILFCSLQLSAQGTTSISGTLVGSDAKAMKMAHVHAAQYSSTKDVALSFNVKSDGSFAFKLPNGWYSLEFSGVDHMHLSSPYYVYCCGKDVKLHVQLQGNEIESKVDSVGIVLDVDKYAFGSVHMMSPAGDGTWSYTQSTSADTVGYQVIVYTGSTEDVHSVNGTQSDWYVYDGGGDYRSVIRTTNGSARIVFDPRAAARVKAEASCEFIDDFSIAVSAILKEQREHMTQYFKEYTKRQDGKEYSWNPAARRSALADRFKTEADPALKQLLMMSYLSVESFSVDSTGADPKVVDEILNTVSPSSVVWGNYQFAILSAIRMSSHPESDYAERVLRENPIAGVKATVLYGQLKDRTDRKLDAEAQVIYDQLMKEYGDTYTAQRAMKELNPARRVKIGAHIPEFAFESVEDSTQKVSPATVHGKWILIDNWATWCGPCVGEMGSLHKAYEKFKDKNFSILSVSFDRTKSDIAKFRKGKWSMPWLHCFSPGVWQNEAAKVFEVSGIPKPILIDPDGNIVSLGSELRGSSLEQTLAKFIK